MSRYEAPQIDVLEPVVDIDAQKFTDNERELILQVIKRDEEVRIQEKSRIKQLKEELHDLREKGVFEGQEETYGRVCLRCRSPLGLFFNSGALCPNCDKKVCKTCRIPYTKSEQEHTWLCTVCAKVRDIRAESGAWFYDGTPKTEKKRKVYGSFLVKKIFTKSNRKRDAEIFKDPNLTDIFEDDDLPDDEDDDYLMISAVDKGGYVFHKGKNHPDQNKAVVKDMQKTSIEKQPLKLIALVQPQHDNAVCLGSGVTPSFEQPENSQNVIHNGEELSSGNENRALGDHSPDIYYPSKESISSGNDIDQTLDQEGDDRDYEIKVEHGFQETMRAFDKDEDEMTENYLEDEVDKTLSADLRFFGNDESFKTKLLVGGNIDEEISEKSKNIKNSLNLQVDFSPPLSINFSAMSKANAEISKDRAFIVHNDLDLLDFQKNFVRRKSPRVLKLRTEEHSSECEDSSSESEDDVETIIQQVVPEKRDSDTEELLKLHKSVEKEDQKVFFLCEENLLDKASVSREKTESKYKVDESLPIDFSKMTKIGAALAIGNNEISNGDDVGLNAFVASLRFPRKLKFSKERTVEHCDRDGSSSESSEDDEDFKRFINEVPGSKEFVVNGEVSEEVFEKHKRFQTSSNIEVPVSSRLNINFSSMSKANAEISKDRAFIVHNDLDLLDFQKNFVRRKSPRVLKLRTEEHSSECEDSSSESEDDVETIIQQVVPEKRDSDTEELLKLHKSVEKEDQKVFFLCEENLLDKASVSREKTESKYKVDESLPIDFSKMTKIGAALAIGNNEISNGDDVGLNAFVASLRFPRKLKFSKERTVEHCDRDGSSSESSEDDEDFKRFINEVPGSKEFVVNGEVSEEVFEKHKRFQTSSNIEVPVSSRLNINFSSMSKANAEISKDRAFIVHNDLDLLDFQKNFVRRKSPRVLKLRTEEHSSECEDSSSESEDDVETIIQQVVPEKRDSDTEELLKLHKSVEKEDQKVFFLCEENLLDKASVSREKTESKYKVDESLPIDFSKMTKIGAALAIGNNEISNGDDVGLNAFVASLRFPRKLKFSKERTVEHCDRDGSSSESSEDDVSLGTSEDTTNSHALSIQIKNEDDKEIADLFAEHKEIKNIETSSIGSAYSAYDDFANVAGEILLGLKYDFKENTFEVQVHRAKDLIAVDKRKNTTDPYVKVYLLPDGKKTGKRKTKAKKHDLNPEFDEVLNFKIPYEELALRVCLVSVWHNHSFDKNIHLGEVSINIHDYIASGFSLEDPSPQWHTLSSKKMNKDDVMFVGNLELRLCYEPPSSQVTVSKKELKKHPDPTKGNLQISVVKAMNLTKLEEKPTGFNAYFKAQLILGKRTLKFKSHHVKQQTEPNWDSSFSFDNVSWNELQRAVLQISVYDREVGLLGGVRLGLGVGKDPRYDSFGDEVVTWQILLDNPNETHSKVLPMRSTLHSVKHEISAPPIEVKIITEDEHDEIKKKKKLGGSQTSLAKRFLNADAMSLASSGSMLSIYSMAGGEHNNLPITGEILFSVKHDVNSGIFTIDVEKAKGIAAVDQKKMISDPYVKTYLLPDKLKTSKKKTTHRRKTVNPVWNEAVKYKLNREELLKKTLQLTIWNHDRFGRNDFLGEVQLNMKHYAASNDLDNAEGVWYTLKEAAPVSAGGLDENAGEILLAVKYDHDVLTVQLKEAHGLIATDASNQPSPFVKCYFLPDKSRKGKRKTHIQKKNINPEWNEKFDFKAIPLEDLQVRVLEITVWDYNKSGHQFLGGCRLGLPGDEYWRDCFGKEVKIWEAMLKHLGIAAEFTVPLRNTMTSRKGEGPVEIPMFTEKLEHKLEETKPEYQDLFQSYDRPTIRLALQYCTIDSKSSKKKKKDASLKVHLKEAKVLPKTPQGDLPSTFCKAFLHPKKKGFKHKTESYIHSVDPIWDSEFIFDGVDLEELRQQVLEIQVYDEDTHNKKPRLIGFVRLGSGGFLQKWDDSMDSERETWFSMLNNPNRWNMNSVSIRLEKYPEVEEKQIELNEKKTKKEDKKKKFVEDEEDSEPEPKPDPQDQDGSESPRTSALRAMGAHAANVIDIMHTKDPVEQHFYPPPQESLTAIVEEDELESSGSVNKPEVPQITINVVKPGAAPFERKEEDEDDSFDMDYSIRKQPPAMSLLKRSTSHESLTSVYSTDSANIYGHVPIRGELQFGMKYSWNNNVFEVHIFQAQDIAAVETKKQLSDAYCKVYLLPDKTKASKKKTKTRKKTLHPKWEEILQYKITERDLRTRTLNVSLWHKERLGRNIFLGEVMLPMDHIVDERSELENPNPKWYTLCEKGSAPMAELFKGELKLALMFENPSAFQKSDGQKDFDDEFDKKGKKKKKKKEKSKSQTSTKIHVHIKEGVDLPAADKNGFSDPFCKCYVIPAKSQKTKRKTPVIKRTCNPQWDYKIEYDLDYEDLADNGIEFVVWDHDRNSKNDFLGCTRINLGTQTSSWDDAQGVEIEAWRHLMDKPNEWREFTLPLRSKMDPRPPKLF